MRKSYSVLFSFVLILSFFTTALAQEAAEIEKLIEDEEGDGISVRDMSRLNRNVVVADSLYGWDLSWVGGLNGAQASYDNWSQGGVNTISVTASTVFNAKYRKGQFAYAFLTNLKYGKTRIEEQGTRKTDDRIMVNNKFSYLFADDRWSAFGNINFSTQFDEGFDYNVPEGEQPILISEFFAPAYFTQMMGIAFAPADYFTLEGGMAFKETIISDTRLSERYGLEAGETFRFEPGYSVALNLDKKIFSNVQLISTVETFSNFQRHIDQTDVHFSNELIGKINNVMNMSVQFVMIYDTDYSKEVQIKQVLSLGLSYSIL